MVWHNRSDFWTMVLEKTLESHLECKEIKLVNPKGNQSWIFTGRTDTEAPILWPPDEKNWLIRKDPDARKDWRKEEKGTTEDKMVRWHARLNEHEFEQTPGVGDGQGSLACCSPWSCKIRHNWANEWTGIKGMVSFEDYLGGVKAYLILVKYLVLVKAASSYPVVDFSIQNSLSLMRSLDFLKSRFPQVVFQR